MRHQNKQIETKDVIYLLCFLFDLLVDSASCKVTTNEAAFKDISHPKITLTFCTGKARPRLSLCGMERANCGGDCGDLVVVSTRIGNFGKLCISVYMHLIGRGCSFGMCSACHFGFVPFDEYRLNGNLFFYCHRCF